MFYTSKNKKYIMKQLFISIFLLVTLFFLYSCGNRKQSENKEVPQSLKGIVQTLSDDGAWCWFSDPRAIYYSENEIITGWVKKDGSVEVACLDISKGKAESNIIFPQLQADDHDNPAFTILPDGNILTMYAWHGGKRGVISNATTKGADVFSFGRNKIFIPRTDYLLEKFPMESYTYANPYVLKGEDNKLFSFGRWIGYKPNMIISNDNGETWEEQYVIISREPFDGRNRPYTKYYSDGNSKIHMVFTDGHPAVEPSNSVYYCYYESGAFWNAEGKKICNISELPFQPEDASLVYKPDNNFGRAWIADIVVKEEGKPIILYTRHPKETDHRYHYVWYNTGSQKWEDHLICHAGKWFPQTQEGKEEREKYYSGNLTLNPLNPNVVYLSRDINGTFEIERFVTGDGGENWEITPVTSDSEYDNVRPYVPRYPPEGAGTVVLWMENRKYIHFTDFDTSIKYFIDDINR
jgi:hypothetical protein